MGKGKVKSKLSNGCWIEGHDDEHDNPLTCVDDIKNQTDIDHQEVG